MVDPDDPQARHLHVLLPDPSVHARVVPGDSLTPTLDEIEVSDDPARWGALGFVVDGAGQLDIGAVRLGIKAPRSDPGRGIVGWSLRGIEGDTSIDGLRTTRCETPERPAAPAHPNRAIAMDHVVVATPDFERTLAAFDSAGLELRRVREAGPARQGFFRVGEALLEVVGPREPDGGTLGGTGGPASFWGLTVVVDDIDAAAEYLGGVLGSPRDAVQPGRRIATVRREAGLGCPVALITPQA